MGWRIPKPVIVAFGWIFFWQVIVHFTKQDASDLIAGCALFLACEALYGDRA